MKRVVQLLLGVAMSLPAVSVAQIWQEFAAKTPDSSSPYIEGRQLVADTGALSDLLGSVTSNSHSRITLPMPEGGMRVFSIVPYTMMAPALASKFPAIKTYKVRAVDDPHVTGRLDFGPNGFHGYIRDHGSTVFIDPQPQTAVSRYVTYYQADYAAKHSERRKNYSCGVHQPKELMHTPVHPLMTQRASAPLMAKTEGALQSYRLAVAATSEYSDKAGNGNKANTLNAIVTAINRVNEVYEIELGIHLELVANNDAIIYTTASDPYTNSNPSLLLSENQTNLDAVIGSANYDIGHVFSTTGGGLAALGVVCNNSFKAQGETGLSNPFGDAFYIDLVAHELGHQFGANHTFNGTSGACGPNRNPSTAFEPGSGVTIMGYAGICSSENLSTGSIDAFHAGSVQEIVAYTRTGTGSTCDAPGMNAGNAAPVVNAGSDYTIPGGTSFELTGSATDADSMTYRWEQMDAGSATNFNSYGLDLGTNALFRTFDAEAVIDSNNLNRLFPDRLQIFSGALDKSETVPTQSRELNLRLTVRDDKGGVDSDDVVVTVDGENAGPFAVLQPNVAQTLNSSQDQVIEWNVACTDGSSNSQVSCAAVDISYTTDDGVSFTSLLNATANNGVATVNFSSANLANVRIKIACSDNVFFDVSDNPVTLSSVAGNVLTASGNSGNTSCGTQVDYGAANIGNDVEPNDSAPQAQSITLPFSVVGGIDDTVDFFDVFSFVSSGGAYTANLSDFGSTDLDLYVFDENGEILSASDTTNTTETIRLGLPVGKTFYVLVEAYDTMSTGTTYSLSVNRQANSPSSGGGGSMSVFYLCLLSALFSLRFVNRRPCIV